MLRMKRVVPKQSHGGGQLGNLSKRFIQLVLRTPVRREAVAGAGKRRSRSRIRGSAGPPTPPQFAAPAIPCRSRSDRGAGAE